MHSDSINAVLSAVRRKHGRDAISYYGSNWRELHGTCFQVTGIPATVSVHTKDGTLDEGLYDVQIEGVPPGDYIYVAVLELPALLSVIDQLAGPPSKWPMSAAYQLAGADACKIKCQAHTPAVAPLSSTVRRRSQSSHSQHHANRSARETVRRRALGRYARRI